MTGERYVDHRYWICKLAHGGHLGYANWLTFKLKQDNPLKGVQKKNCEDRINIATRERLRRQIVKE